MISIGNARLLTVLVCSITRAAAAQLDGTQKTDLGPTVYRERIVAVFPPPYVVTTRPNPAVPGYYAWKIVFGDSDATVVFRTSSAIASSRDRQIVSAGAMYRCTTPEQPMLECTKSLSGSARAGANAMTIEITDAQIVQWVREHRPHMVTRLWFEPGGRFRVEQVQVVYSDGKPGN